MGWVHQRRLLFVSFLALCYLQSLSMAQAKKTALYGSKIRYAKGQPIVFEDFTLTFLGERHVKNPIFKPGFYYSDFRISKNKEQKTISWSSGTGVIEPLPFEIGGKQFLLELRHSELFPPIEWLKEDELVVRYPVQETATPLGHKLFEELDDIDAKAFNMAEKVARGRSTRAQLSLEAQTLQNRLKAIVEELKKKDPQVLQQRSDQISEAFLDLKYVLAPQKGVSLRLNQVLRVIDTKNNQKQQDKYDVIIHKIAGLGDIIRDTRTYAEACQGSQYYLNERYQGILKFQLLESDYEENKGARAYRRSFYQGGQYFCRFGGLYLEGKKRQFKNTGTQKFESSKFPGIVFSYPLPEGFKTELLYNDAKNTAEIVFTDTKPGDTIYKPTLIVGRFDSLSQTLKSDIIKKNPGGIPYKIWDDHHQNSVDFYFMDIYDNLDTTIEFAVADKEVYEITTANFIYYGLPEKPILDIIIESFKKKN